MRKTVVGTFDSRTEAEQVAELLVQRGFERRDIDIRASGMTTGASMASSHDSTSWWEWLFGESEDRSYYSDRMNQGGAILAVTADEGGAERTRRLMEAEGGDVAANQGADAVPESFGMIVPENDCPPWKRYWSPGPCVKPLTLEIVCQGVPVVRPSLESDPEGLM